MTDHAAVVYPMRICYGAAHLEGCHHQGYLRQGVEAFLASARVRDALTLALANWTVPSIDPAQDAERLLAYLATVE